MTTDPTSPTSLSCRPTEFLDFETDAVQAFVAAAVTAPSERPAEQAVQLYYAVRDGLSYEVYGADMSREGLRASTIVHANQGFCVHKSILFAAAVRALGIPSRLVVADVRNHLASERLKALVGGEVFVHWLTSIHVEGRWVRATPVFNKLLCRLYRMTPLEFDGITDSLHQAYDEHGRQHMQFLQLHGEFDDVAYEQLIGLMAARHPAMFASGTVVPGGGSLAAEAPHHPTSHGARGATSRLSSAPPKGLG